MDWTKKHMHWKTKWTKTIFSDEKKFNLDGPDGYRYYWHNLRKEKQYFSKRHFGGGSLMVCRAFGWNGNTDLSFVEGGFKSEDYIHELESHLLPSAKKIGGKDYIFQQDNASIHLSNETKEWSKGKQITVLDWPVLSPDFNLMENVWGIMVRRLYVNEKKYDTVAQLKSSILEIWKAIEHEIRHNLINSMPNRIFKLIKKSAASIDY